MTPFIFLMNLQFRRHLAGIAFPRFTWRQLGWSKAWGWDPLQTLPRGWRCLSAEISRRTLAATPACDLSTWLPSFLTAWYLSSKGQGPKRKRAGGITNLRSHVVSLPPYSLGCGLHRVLPMFKERERRSHLLTEECWHHFVRRACEIDRFM